MSCLPQKREGGGLFLPHLHLGFNIPFSGSQALSPRLSLSFNSIKCSSAVDVGKERPRGECSKLSLRPWLVWLPLLSSFICGREERIKTVAL